MDPLKNLPIEVCQEIFLNITSEQDIKSALNVSQTWNTFIKDCGPLWRKLCYNHCPKNLVEEEQALGYSWMEIYQRCTSEEGIKRQWMRGAYSNLNTPEKLPTKHMCPLTAEDWGDILEAELQR